MHSDKCPNTQRRKWHTLRVVRSCDNWHATTTFSMSVEGQLTSEVHERPKVAGGGGRVSLHMLGGCAWREVIPGRGGRGMVVF